MLREIIRYNIHKQNISYYKLAKLTGLQITQIKNYVIGKTDLLGGNIEKLFKALKVEL